ncbi:hypothetical protein HCA33_05475 [Listeria seeligeri]|uniref:hypothetical protein n=1 Tax=Listeria seeligeri TaxID=1640 RepID=UPI0016243068|nr:hypothetical protein [Listeria seeligeri]EAF5538178.1 hypothetical protein [Listeria monocytogenes]MBC1879464.1 hypothetical protein [Listeria seeligeri]MBC2224176.1 hypothetical protein [Listeria seeligeri]MBC2229748.1 hypothetical protein [Listeria seeligeri]MBC6115371.1 hypothetical protein [Listeria seeligeri]
MSNMIELVGYHGTSRKQGNDILSNGFKEIKFTPNRMNKLPGDLGCGIYFFVDNYSYGFNGYDCAHLYSRRFCSKRDTKIHVLDVDLLFTEDMDILDLDVEENKEKFIKAKQNLTVYVNRFIKQNLEDLTVDGSYKRGNFDGVYLEAMFSKGQIKEVHAVSKNTFTRFDDNAKISNFPNSSEVSLRKLEVIKNKEVRLYRELQLYNTKEVIHHGNI